MIKAHACRVVEVAKLRKNADVLKLKQSDTPSNSASFDQGSIVRAGLKATAGVKL